MSLNTLIPSMSITCFGILYNSFLNHSFDQSWGGYAPYGKDAIKNKLLQYLNSINYSSGVCNKQSHNQLRTLLITYTSRYRLKNVLLQAERSRNSV